LFSLRCYNPQFKDRIEDAVLIDVTATAREAGIRYPVALATVWERYVALPPSGLQPVFCAAIGCVR
jgi:hypothetical protein